MLGTSGAVLKHCQAREMILRSPSVRVAMAVMVEGGAVECWSIGGVEVIGLDELYGFGCGTRCWCASKL